MPTNSSPRWAAITSSSGTNRFVETETKRGSCEGTFTRANTVWPFAGLRTVEVWRDPLVAALPARHPLAARPAVELADLAGLRLALTPRRNHPSLVDLVVGACAEAGFEPRPSTGAGTLQDTLSAIGAGQPLWTVVYAAHARLLRSERVAFLPFRDAGLALTTSLVLRAAAPTPQSRALLAACRAAAGTSTADSAGAATGITTVTSDDNDR